MSILKNDGIDAMPKGQQPDAAPSRHQQDSGIDQSLITEENPHLLIGDEIPSSNEPTQPNTTQQESARHNSGSTAMRKDFIGYAPAMLLLICIAITGTYISDNSDKIAELRASLQASNGNGGSDINSQDKTTILSDLSNLNRRLGHFERSLNTLHTNLDSQADATSTSNSLSALRTSVTTLQKRVNALQKQLEAAARAKRSASKNTIASTLSPPQSKASGTQWGINIAALGNKSNAQLLLNKVSALNIAARMDAVPSNGSTLWRIRAVGYNSKIQAQQDAKRIETALKLAGLWVNEIK